MQRKFLFTLILIIMICFSFTITSFASTDFSKPYWMSDYGYYLYIDFEEQTHLDLPLYNNMNTNYYSSSDIYFILYCTKDSTTGKILYYSLYSSSSPLRIYEKSGSIARFESDTPIVYSSIHVYSDGLASWTYSNTRHSSFDVDIDNVLMSSDNFSYNGDIVFYKYIKSPLARTFQTVGTKNSVMKEIVVVLPAVLVVIVGFVGIRKGIKFIKRKTQNA